ncbi:hypothetical protein Snoj_71750 [Streptomyces nojiriensis]|uniref:Uncharacterized protein n=1 Tax=Streptomyces nojiriensis TaxID=66374 RepID=A0ABQ3SYP0_9ACTN|nr:hypothetical protein GCM10010205_32620 [Streptomyces nojiriensis]GHI73257.1 hypothetical protein Snoj_71750 [Streptomyces nojiriensis]
MPEARSQLAAADTAFAPRRMASAAGFLPAARMVRVTAASAVGRSDHLGQRDLRALRIQDLASPARGPPGTGFDRC